MLALCVCPQDLVQDAVDAVVGSRVPADEPLMAAGLDSIAAVELQQTLTDALGLTTLPPMLVFDHPTVAALAAHLHALMMGNLQAVYSQRDASLWQPPARHGAPAAEIWGIAGAPGCRCSIDLRAQVVVINIPA